LEVDRLLFRLEPAPRDGLSLPRYDCPFPSHHYGIDVPGLPLRFALRNFRPARSAYDSFALSG
jgi:hypothetical protein